MSCRDSETIELLSTPQRTRWRRKKTAATRSGYQSEGGATVLDVQAQNNCEELSESPQYLSDQGLPSERRRLAATNRYRELQRSGREEAEESSGGERAPLLASQTKETAFLSGYYGSGQPVLLRRDNNEGTSADNHPTNVYQPMAGKESRGGMTLKKERVRLRQEKCYNYSRLSRVTLLTLILVVCVILFSLNKEHSNHLQIITVSGNNVFESTTLTYNKSKNWNHVVLSISGPFIDESFVNGTKQDQSQFLFICGCQECPVTDKCQSVRISSLPTNSTDPPTFRSSNVITRSLPYDKDDFHMEFSSSQNLSFEMSVRGEILSDGYQVLVATIILIFVYFLITFDIVHRTIAAFIGSTATLATLSMLDKRPTLDTVVEWIDLDTICLLFGMMTLVAIFSQTGFFDYSAVKAYKVARGKIGPLIIILCFLSAIVSAFLDNVTTILLLTPVSIRLSQVLNVDPLPVLIAEVIFSNIGGTATAVGDPPNVIIVSNDLIKSYDIGFAEFSLHLSLGIVMCMFVAYGVLGIMTRTYVKLRNKDPPHIAEMKREIAIWERTALQMPVVSLEERAVRDALRAKANEVRSQLNQEVMSVQSTHDLWQKNLAQLERQYRITNIPLLIKSSAVLVVVILLFFIANILPGIELELGWIAIFGAVILLVLSDTQDLEPVLHKIEWTTLLFFAGLFVLMEGLQELGLIEYIGNIMIDVIKNVSPEDQMWVALIMVLWISALASSFIDNIPFTTATIPVIVELAKSPELCLSLRPLVWALAFGACLGGNGTLIGASANVVCAGIAEQNGYKISFVKFFIIGFPMMLATTLTAMVYLLIAHKAFDWDIESCDIL